MARPLIPLQLVAALGIVMGLPAARADIYTWVDANGSTNISNLAPADGVRVIKVTRETPRTDVPALAAAAARQAEIDTLAERVRQLEGEATIARRDAAAASAPPPPPPVIQYFVTAAPAAPQYVEPAPPQSAGCDPSWYGCSIGFWPGFYPSVIVVPAPRSRGFEPHRGGHQGSGRPPMRGPNAMRRG